MLMDRVSIYRLVVHLRSIDVKLDVEIVHKVNYLTYNKDGEYKIKIRKILENKYMISNENIYQELIKKFEEFKPNFTAVSSKEISV